MYKRQILEKVNEQMDGKYVIEYTYVANTDYNNVLSTQLASGEGPDIIMDGTNYPAEDVYKRQILYV